VHAELLRTKKSLSEYSSGMDFDSMLCTRHAACFITGVPPEKISKSSPEVMIELEAIFADYTHSPNSIFGDLMEIIGALFYEADPLRVVEKDNPNQLDEYFPEADMVIWLHFSKKLSPRAFWAVWEYQLADMNPYKSEKDALLGQCYKKVIELLRSKVG
jgi:hypothetical protein